MVTESLLAVVGPTTFVVRKLNGEGIECAMPRHRGATVADIIWNLTSTDPIHFNLIGTCLGGSRGLTIPQDTSLDRIDYALPLTLVPQLVGAAPKRRLGFAHPTSSSSSPGPASKPLSAFFAPVTPAQAPATPRLTWVHDLTQTAQSARIGAPLLHDVRGKVTLKAAGLAEGTLHIEYIDKETEYVEREEVDAKTCKGGFATVKTAEADPDYVASLAQPSRQIFRTAQPVYAAVSLGRGNSEAVTVRLDLSTRPPDVATRAAPKTPTNKGGRPQGSKDSKSRKKRFDAGRKKLSNWVYTGSEAQAHGQYMAKYGDPLQHDGLVRVTFLKQLESGRFLVAMRLEGDGVGGSTASPFGTGSAEVEPKECRAGFDGPNYVPTKRAGKEQPAPYVTQAEIEAALGEELALPWDNDGCASPEAVDDFLHEHPDIRSRLQWTDRDLAAELSGARLAVERAWLMYEKPKKGRPRGSKNKPKGESMAKQLSRASKAQVTAVEKRKKREQRALLKGKVLKPWRGEMRLTWTETQRLQGVTLYDAVFAHTPNQGWSACASQLRKTPGFNRVTAANVRYWVKARDKLAKQVPNKHGLISTEAGRPPTLSDEHMKELGAFVRQICNVKGYKVAAALLH